MKLWIDDVRSPPDNNWIWMAEYYSALWMLHSAQISEISLDHDLGNGPSGYDLAKWMSDQNLWPSIVHFHSMNPVGKKNMEEEYKQWLRRNNENRKVD